MAGKADTMTPWVPGALAIMEDAGRKNPYTDRLPNFASINEAIAFTAMVVQLARTTDGALMRIIRQASA